MNVLTNFTNHSLSNYSTMAMPMTVPLLDQTEIEIHENQPDSEDQVATMIKIIDKSLYQIAHDNGEELRKILDCLDQKQVVKHQPSGNHDDLPMSELLSPLIQCTLEGAGFNMTYRVNKLQCIPGKPGTMTPLRWLMSNELNEFAIDLLQHIEVLGFNDLVYLQYKKSSAGLISEMVKQDKIWPEMFLLKIRELYLEDYFYTGRGQFYTDFHDVALKVLPDNNQKTLLHLSSNSFIKITAAILSVSDHELRSINRETPFEQLSTWISKVAFTPCDRLVDFEKDFYFKNGSENLIGWCIRNKEYRVLKELYALEMNFQHPCTPRGETPLVYAVGESSRSIMEFVLENGLHQGINDVANAIVVAKKKIDDLNSGWFVLEKESRIEYWRNIIEHLMKFL